MRAFFILPFLFVGAQALTLTGSAVGELPAKARVAAFTVGPSGQPVSEVASAPAAPAFRLDVPAGAPSGRGLFALSPETIAWPGVTGGLNVPAGLQGGELRLFVYGDANGNGARDAGEALLETDASVGRAKLVVVYAAQAANVTADRGFAANLAAGWNVVTVELGRALKVAVSTNAEGVTLNVGR